MHSWGIPPSLQLSIHRLLPVNSKSLTGLTQTAHTSLLMNKNMAHSTAMFLQTTVSLWRAAVDHI